MDTREWGSECVIFATQDEQPCIVTRNETAISYDERLGNASKTLHIETVMTFDDLRELCKTLMGGGRMSEKLKPCPFCGGRSEDD